MAALVVRPDAITAGVGVPGADRMGVEIRAGAEICVGIVVVDIGGRNASGDTCVRVAVLSSASRAGEPAPSRRPPSRAPSGASCPGAGAVSPWGGVCRFVRSTGSGESPAVTDLRSLSMRWASSAVGRGPWAVTTGPWRMPVP